MTWPRVNGLRTIEFGTAGRLRRELTDAVIHGNKRGTSGLASLDYQAENEDLEHVGEQLVVVDDDGNSVGLIEITAVDVVPFAEVSDDFARSEGEGYEAHADWAQAHRAYWERLGAEIDDDTPVVCVRFDLVSKM
jgi:uncharacterized protein YhfF